MKSHVCGNREIYTLRMQLALYLDDEVNYHQIVREIAGCARCWENIAHWSVSLLAGDQALRAGSRARAADLVTEDLARLMPTE
jgi:hypothetical protein